MKKIIRMFLLSIFITIMLFISICFEDFKVRMGIIIFMYSFSFFIIMKCEGGIQMAESRIKIRATANEINKNFNETPSKYYNIKYFKGEKYCEGKDDVPIVFETLIRHNEIGNRSIERSSPYTLDTLEKTLEEKVKEYEQEQMITKDDNEYTI